MMMVMVFVSVFAVESSLAGVMPVHPMSMLPMPRNPNPLVTRIPIGWSFIIRAIAYFDMQIQCVSAWLQGKTGRENRCDGQDKCLIHRLLLTLRVKRSQWSDCRPQIIIFEARPDTNPLGAMAQHRRRRG